MKIAFDAQLFLDKEKTGIGWYGINLLEILNKENNYEFQFNTFKNSLHKDELKCFDKYLKQQNFNYKIYNNEKMKSSIYRILSTFLPISYSSLFGSSADVTVFLNYVIPPKVSGKKITMIHDLTYKAYPKTQKLKSRIWLSLTMKRTCKYADYIVTASEFSKNEIMKYFKIPENKIKVLSCGVDTNLFHDNYSNEDVIAIKDKYNILGEYYLYTGTLEPRKNIERLIMAYQNIKVKYKYVPKLVISGKKGWLYNNIFKLVKELQLESSIIFTGYIEEKDVPILMYGARIFIYPSLYEGFGMPPLEAMACRTAVIVSNVASLPEVVGDAGLLVNPLSTSEIEQSIVLLEQNEELRKEYMDKGYERSKLFTWSNVNRNFTDVLSKLNILNGRD